MCDNFLYQYTLTGYHFVNFRTNASIFGELCGGGTTGAALYDIHLDFWNWAPNIFCTLLNFLDTTSNKNAFSWLLDAFGSCFQLQFCLLLNYIFEVVSMVVGGRPILRDHFR